MLGNANKHEHTDQLNKHKEARAIDEHKCEELIVAFLVEASFILLLEVVLKRITKDEC